MQNDCRPYPIPETNLPKSPGTMDGAMIIMTKLKATMQSATTIIYFLPIQSASYPPKRAPTAAPKEKMETKNSLSGVEGISSPL